jgi:prepilin-type N-terminal cleavage/methylation domain-containing protein
MSAPARNGFTLIEVMAAVGAFTIAFLTGFAAIGTFMIKQDLNYQRTVAASAAMFLAKWHSDKVLAGTGGTRPVLVNATVANSTASGPATSHPLKMLFPQSASQLTTASGGVYPITFKGGDFSRGNDALYMFNSGATMTGAGSNSINTALRYDILNLVVSIAPTVNESVSGGNNIPLTQVSFWYGTPADVQAASSTSLTTLQFLGRFIIADPF